MITGTFGPVVFSASNSKILTYAGLSGDTQARYHDHEIIGQKPRREFLSDGLKKYTLSVRLDAGMGVNPTKELKKLEDIRAEGVAHPLILGGDYKGRFTIDGVSHTNGATDKDGAPIVITVSINMTEYI